MTRFILHNIGRERRTSDGFIILLFPYVVGLYKHLMENELVCIQTLKSLFPYN